MAKIEIFANFSTDAVEDAGKKGHSEKNTSPTLGAQNLNPKKDNEIGNPDNREELESADSKVAVSTCGKQSILGRNFEIKYNEINEESLSKHSVIIAENENDQKLMDSSMSVEEQSNSPADSDRVVLQDSAVTSSDHDEVDLENEIGQKTMALQGDGVMRPETCEQVMSANGGETLERIDSVDFIIRERPAMDTSYTEESVRIKRKEALINAICKDSEVDTYAAKLTENSEDNENRTPSEKNNFESQNLIVESYKEDLERESKMTDEKPDPVQNIDADNSEIGEITKKLDVSVLDNGGKISGKSSLIEPDISDDEFLSGHNVFSSAKTAEDNCEKDHNIATDSPGNPEHKLLISDDEEDEALSSSSETVVLGEENLRNMDTSLLQEESDFADDILNRARKLNEETREKNLKPKPCSVTLSEEEIDIPEINELVLVTDDESEENREKVPENTNIHTNRDRINTSMTDEDSQLSDENPLKGLCRISNVFSTSLSCFETLGDAALLNSPRIGNICSNNGSFELAQENENVISNEGQETVSENELEFDSRIQDHNYSCASSEDCEISMETVAVDDDGASCVERSES